MAVVKDSKESDVGLSGFRRDITLGFTRNGGVPVRVYNNDIDGWVVSIGAAELRVPDVDCAFGVAIGWITGSVRVMSRPIPKEPKP